MKKVYKIVWEDHDATSSTATLDEKTVVEHLEEFMKDGHCFGTFLVTKAFKQCSDCKRQDHQCEPLMEDVCLATLSGID